MPGPKSRKRGKIIKRKAARQLGVEYRFRPHGKELKIATHNTLSNARAKLFSWRVRK